MPTDLNEIEFKAMNKKPQHQVSDLFPALPHHVPHRSATKAEAFFRRLYQAQGWQIHGEIPNIPKALLIAAPHTSNIDGWYGLLAMLGLGLKITIMAKHTLFKAPFDQFFRWAGMIPVNRQHPEGLIEHLNQEIQRNKNIWIALAPEGTRKHAGKWKSGFYRLAYAANIPLVMVAFDYQNKAIRILGTFQCSGDYEHDLPKILAYYQGNFSPKHEHLLSDQLREYLK